MIKYEYKTVTELAKENNMSTKNVRRICHKIQNDYSKELIYQDSRMQWYIHHLLVSKFKRQRKNNNKYYALNIDPKSSYTVSDIDKIMQFVFDQMGNVNLEINYVVEHKKANNKNHIHCYVKCNDKKKLLGCIRLAFFNISYHQSIIYDLNGWKEYITKEENKIKTLKKQKHE